MKIISLSQDQRKELSLILSKFKSYSQFSRNKDAAYRYAKVFKIRVCPYCNIHFIDTIPDIVRPEFDHFIPKSSPQGKGLELDASNLIPACHECNSIIKKDKVFDHKTHLHPFYDDFDSIIRFCIDLISPDYLNEENFNIIFIHQDKSSIYNSRANNTIRDLELKKRYQHHKDYVIEILRFIKHYNYQNYDNILNDIGIKTDFLYSLEILLSSFIDDCINNTPLGKLRRDILLNYL